MSDWWNKKLKGEKPSPLPTYPNPAMYSNRPVQPQESQVSQQPMSPDTQISMGQAIRTWKGGEAHRREGNMRCPDCGSNHVFSRTGKGANSMINGAAPAPRCYECGWNGKYSQADQTNWAV